LVGETEVKCSSVLPVLAAGGAGSGSNSSDSEN